MQASETTIRNAYDAPFAPSEMTREQMYEAMAEIEKSRENDTVEKTIEIQDKTVRDLLIKYAERSREGMKTYGISMKDNPSDLEFWLRSAQEEAMDLSLYLERAIDELQRKKKEPTDATLPLIF